MRAWAWLARNVVTVQATIETDRLGERLDAGVGAALEAPAPGLAHGRAPESFTAENAENAERRREKQIFFLVFSLRSLR